MYSLSFLILWCFLELWPERSKVRFCVPRDSKEQTCSNFNKSVVKMTGWQNHFRIWIVCRNTVATPKMDKLTYFGCVKSSCILDNYACSKQKIVLDRVQHYPIMRWMGICYITCHQREFVIIITSTSIITIIIKTFFLSGDFKPRFIKRKRMFAIRLVVSLHWSDSLNGVTFHESNYWVFNFPKYYCEW